MARYLARNEASRSVAAASWTGRSRPTTRWASTTPGAARTRTCTSATTRCSASGSATRTGSTARGCGSRSRSRRSWASTTSARSSRSGSIASSSSARQRVAALRRPITEQSHPARHVDGLGRTATTPTPTRTTTRSGPSWRSAIGRGLIYRGHDVMPWCPRCGTGLSNMELATEGYRELTHLSLTLRLPITSDGHEDEDLLVWTTTPWTLSSNVAAAVHPELTYVLVEGRDGRRWWLSARLAAAGRAGGDGRPRGEGRRAGRADLPRPVRRAAGRSRASSTASSPGTEVVGRGGDRHRAHRPGLRPGGLRARRGSSTWRSSTRSTSSASSADGFGWQSGRFAGDRRPRRRRPRAGGGRRPRAQGAAGGAASSTATRYPVCWRCGTQLDLPAGRRVVHRHGSAARAESARSTRDGPPGCRRGSASRSASSTGSGTWATG